eukprot:COSAG01_NODE_26355_length_716_cov_4.470016_1_plen_154_part_10
MTSPTRPAKLTVTPFLRSEPGKSEPSAVLTRPRRPALADPPSPTRPRRPDRLRLGSVQVLLPPEPERELIFEGHTPRPGASSADDADKKRAHEEEVQPGFVSFLLSTDAKPLPRSGPSGGVGWSGVGQGSAGRCCDCGWLAHLTDSSRIQDRLT